MISIPYGRQDISDEDINAVVDVLRSNYLTQGPLVGSFETAVSTSCGANHAVAFNSATSALHAACLALGLKEGDTLWTSPNTFVASANCGLYCGANVDFVDIDPRTWNICVAALELKLIEAKRSGVIPKIVVPVHFAGQPTEQEKIYELSRQYGFKILEDASHSIGSSRNGESIGNCRWSDITIFSFHPVKILTTGEGGMALCNDQALAEHMRLLCSHGITREAKLMRSPDPAPWQYEQQMLGFNYRMTDIQAALGLSQLTRLKTFVERRNNLAHQYIQALVDLPLQLPVTLSGNYSAYHLFVVRIKQAALAKNHREIFQELRHRGIGVNLHYMPVYLQPYYRELGFAPGLCPEAERYANEAITLPLYPGLTNEQLLRVTQTLREVLTQ